MTKRLLILSFILTGCFTILAPVQATTPTFEPNEQDPYNLISNESGNLGKKLNLGDVAAPYIAFSLINSALSLLGGLCLVLLVYAGFIWIWARGNAEEVTKAKDIIKGTVIGLIIVLAALGITRFVFTTIGTISGAQVESK